MAITLKEIAELAGVSRGTVDRALKNRAGVNAQTKARILKIAEEHSYKPNLIGKALVYSNRNIMVEVVLNSLGNAFFAQVKQGLLDAESAYADYGIRIHLTEIKGYDEAEMLACLDALPEKVKSVILTPVNSARMAQKINALTKKGVQVILLSSDVQHTDRLTYVGCDYLKSGRIAGRLTQLISGGQAELCVTTGSLQHYGHRQRVEGMQEVLAAYPAIHTAAILENNDDDTVAYEKTKAALQAHPKIDFVYITTGGVRGTLRAVEECGRKIQVCSFDDTDITRAALHRGVLAATICQQPYAQGYNAVKSVFDSVVAHAQVPQYQYSNLYIKVDQSI